MDKVISSYIDLPGMNNTRDLGGMKTKDGRTVKPGLLLRSGRLNNLRDTAWMAEHVGLIVDMRSSRELEEEPDPVIPGVEYLHLPIFEMQASGVTRDKKSDRSIPNIDPSNAVERMSALYSRFVADDFSRSQYARFVRLLLEPREKAVLWHCTAGKDRTGVGALIVQELLGVDRETIMADYLITNVYLAEEIRELCEMQARRLGGMDEETKKAFIVFMGACEEYPMSVYAKAEELFGSFEGFLRDGLGVSEADRQAFREKYLD